MLHSFTAHDHAMIPDSLQHPGALLEAANSAIFGLGPLGSYEVGIQGRWLPDASQAGSTVQIAFDAYSVRLVGYLGLQLPAGLPKVRCHGSHALYGLLQRITRSTGCHAGHHPHEPTDHCRMVYTLCG